MSMQNRQTLIRATCSRISNAVSRGSESLLSSLPILAENLANTGGNRALTTFTGVSTLPAPTNLDAISWTSPEDATRSIDSASAYEAVKREYDPKRAQRAAVTRLTPSGEVIEVDIFDPG